MIDLLDLFFNHIKGKANLRAGAIMLLKQHIVIEKIPKNTCLLQYGAISNKMYFICQGAMRGEMRRMVNGEWKYKSSRFMLEQEIVFNVSSFRKCQPSKEAIYTLEPVVALTITRDEYYAIEAAFTEMGILRAELALDVIELDNRRLDGIQTLDTAERVQYLLDFEPEWIIRIPHKYLASYIMTSPENFSRIMKKLRRGGSEGLNPDPHHTPRPGRT